jgi:MarR family transcriptional regulator, organic hydroperoxide resistance regulator
MIAREIPLDDVLRFMRMIWAIDHELERVSKRMETRLGLTIPQRMSLLLIGRHPGILASELAVQLHLHRGTVSGLVRRLEAAGYVSRTVDPSDGRRAGLTLTVAGRAMNRRRTGTFEDAVRQLLAAVPTADLATAEHVLARLGSELRAAGDLPPEPREQPTRLAGSTAGESAPRRP